MMYKRIYISIGLLWSLHHYGQVVLTAPPAPNTEVADPQSIRMLPGFNFSSANGTFRAYIGGSTSGNGGTYTPINVNYSSNIPTTENYIYSRQYLVPTTVSDGSLQQIQNVQFFDGLGRPKQSVSIKSTPTGKDLVTHIPYDNFGRQVDSWLPVPMSSLSGNIQTGVEGSANSYYQANGINDSYPFSHKTLENSPLDRVLNQKNPGNDWQNKPIVFGYEANAAGEVKKYTTITTWVAGATSSELIASGTYGEAQLYKNTVTDEDTNKTIEFKNGRGQTLLVRKVISSSENADTYYVYNEYDQLAFVIPPLASATPTVSASAMEHLCYQYKYDGRNRLVEKKLPGKGLEQIVYNKKDQIILSRDTVLKNGIANFSADQSWMFTKYDRFGRVVYTGIARDTNPRNTIQNTIDNQTVSAFETRGGSLTLNGVNIEYGNASYPTTMDKLLTVNYYDTYPQEAPVVSTVLGQEVLPQTTQNSTVSTKSLATASYVKNIENDGWTKSYTYYDKKRRTLATHSLNHLGGYTKTESFLKFSGVPTYSLIEHKRSANDTKVNIKETFEYDHQERLIRHWNQVNGGAQELLAENLYNDLGQLQTKNVGNTTGSPLQSVKYVYNIRGWMTKLNDPANLQNKLFAYELRYNNPNNQFSGSARYNGNISQMSWITQNDAVLRNYSYEYDPLNRLKEGRFWDAMNLERGEYHEQLTYDLNGNIKSLLRRGKQLPGYTAPEVMDNLEYHYENGEQSNKLSYLKEIGTGNAISGYPLASGSTGSAITYDVNGNMTTQLDKGISSIQYNYLNLPGKITQNSKVTDYIYRADGVKVRKVFGTETTDYLDGFQYTDSVLKFFPTAEGYFNVETGKYVYNYTDHLGNTRLSYAKNGAGTEIIEESNYYPFGLKHEGYNVLTGNPSYKYKYNGKELQETGMYDYGARFYMADIGRWGVVDPLAEVSRRHSPYNYAYNNPIRFIDPDGKLSQSFMDDLMNKSKGIRTTWTNDGNGNFSDGKGNTVTDKEPDNNLNSPDWASKGPFKVHQRANREGVYRNKTPDYTGSLGEALKALNDGTEYADSDQFQTGAYSYRHAMRNSNETKAQAMKKADEFVRAQFTKARQLLAKGKTYDAYYQFALGLHILQDATSPAHGGFQTWTGNESLKQEVGHVKQELFYPGTNSNLQKVTNYYLNLFQNGGDLPKGNLFQSISHD
ncbi:RHS repeat-associated core domain-containing protein [Chryseobacterium viscerum]|uniref:RHS repeat-associated core domain-containing protein n=2 Tax=Chryseobacterium viscerum TaxID=1037377 RepID=A0A5N4BS88_9FLAO|nr:RHS repeat-associated core domain-containing protein [Chryseobacterium viscerum]